MKTRNILCAFLTLIAVGCVKEQPAGKENAAAGNGKTITVSMPELTRTAIGNETTTGVSLVWSKGDEIAVIEGKGTDVQKHSVYRLIGEGGTTSGTFEYVSGDAVAEVINDVVFPASAVSTLSVPTSQTYVDGSFDADAMVMSWSRTSEDEAITLKHEAAALMFTVTGEANISSVAVVCAEQTYTLVCAEPVALSSEGTVFYVAVPGSEASKDYKVTFTSENSETLTKDFTYALDAGKIGRLPAFAFETTPAVEPLKLGDYFRGGLVFQLEDGFAKVVSIEESLEYWAVESVKSERVETEANPTEGSANTDLFRSRTDLASFPAAAWCISLGEGWYMPSRSEINYIVNGLNLTVEESMTAVNQKLVDYYGQGFSSGKSYLTSCESSNDASKVWTVTIPGKSHNAYTKAYERPVRAVKKIALTGGETADPKPNKQTTITNLSPAKDASLTSSVNGSHTKGSTGPEMKVRYSSTNQYRLATFFEFGLTGINAEELSTAILNLSFRTDFKDSESMILEIRAITDHSWDEDADQKWVSTSDSDLTTVTVNKTDTNASIDLTSLVNQTLGKNETVCGIRIRAKEVEGNKNSGNHLYIYSKEHETESLRPYLQVTTIAK